MDTNNNSFLVTPFDLSDELTEIRDRIINSTPPPSAEVPPPPADTEAPVSTVEVLPNSVPQDFTVTWYGFDPGGSGIASYDVFVSTDGGEFELWQDDTTALSAIYNGERDRQLAFYSVATDNAGNSESTSEAQVSTTTNSDTQQAAIYRLFNTNTGVHLYTANPVERDSVIQNLSNYQYEGISYFAAKSNEGIPVYRLYNPIVDGHFYTVSEAERDSVIQNDPNYVLEGQAFTAFDSQVAGTVPVYRFFIPDSGAYFYTTSEAERESIITNLPNYQFQEVAFYSFPLNADFTPLPPAPDPSNSNFLGSNIFLQLYGPNASTPITQGLSATVREGVEFSGLSDNIFPGGIIPVEVEIDITANSVLFEVPQGSGTFPEQDFRGYIFVDSDGSLPPIASVAIDRSATSLELDDSDINFTENSFSVNVAGSEYNAGDTIKLDFSFGTPEETSAEPVQGDGSNFTGAEIQYQQFFPNSNTPVGDTLLANVGNEAEFVTPASDAVIGESVDISGNSILYQVTDPGGVFSNADFNGIVLSDVSDNLPAIANVTIDSSVTTLDVNNSDIQFDENSVSLNVAGLAYVTGDTIKLDVEFVEL